MLLWVAGFDIIYACQDVEFDRRGRAAQRAGPAGRARGALRLAAACHLGMVAAAGAAAAGVSAFGLDLSGAASRPWPCCWPTSIGWSGPTI